MGLWIGFNLVKYKHLLIDENSKSSLGIRYFETLVKTFSTLNIEIIIFMEIIIEQLMQSTFFKFQDDIFLSYKR